MGLMTEKQPPLNKIAFPAVEVVGVLSATYPEPYCKLN